MSARKRRGRSEGSIFQRDDGLWVGSVSLGYDGTGKRKRRTVYGATKKEVQEKLRELQTKVDIGQSVAASRVTVGQYLDHWLAQIKPTIATHTYLPYKQHVERYISPQLGGVKLTELSAVHVQQFYSDLSEKGVSAAMRYKAGVALQNAVSPLKLIPFNPARGVKKPQHTPKEMIALDPEQAQRLLAEAKADRLFPLYAFLLDTGAREGEAFALQWNDLDFQGGAVQLTKTLEETAGILKVKEAKTKKSRRRVTLTRFAIDALQQHRKAMLAAGMYRPDGIVFCDSRGGYLRKSNVLRRSFRPILKRAGLPTIRPYDLRHSSATLLLLAGVDAKVVSERLGHSSTRLTQDVYQHVLPGMQERASAQLDAIFRTPVKAKA